MIVIVYHRSLGPVIGAHEENLAPGAGIVIEQPMRLVPANNGVAFVPVLILTKESSVEFSLDELYFSGKIFEPQPELRNDYVKNFGGGVII